jgi:hypothetical protein
MIAVTLAALREAIDEAVVDHASTIADPLEDSRLGRMLEPKPDRQWIPVDAITGVVDRLANETAAELSQQRERQGTFVIRHRPSSRR